MLLPRPFITHVSKYVVRKLAKGGFCQFKSFQTTDETFDKIILDDLSLEDAINAEARELLEQYSDYMRQNDVPYHEMFNKVKRNLLEERKVTAATAPERDGRKMKLSRDKVTELSHKLAQQLPRIQGVRVLKPWNDVRLAIAQELTNILMVEEKVDQKARKMIENQQRKIVEGSEEYNVLHRRYYEQEMGRLGVNMTPPAEAPSA